MTSGSFPWQRLSAADVSNFVFEHPGRPQVIGILGELDDDPDAVPHARLDVERVRRVLAPRVAALDRLNQRVLFPRPGQGRPVWVDCPADLDHHVRPGPDLADEAARDDLCGRLLDTPLPRDRPLWDLVVCHGPGPDTVSAVLRLHHALADGMSGAAIMLALFDPSDDAARPMSRQRVLRRPPTGRELAADAWRRRWRAAATVPRRLIGRAPSLRRLSFALVRMSVLLRGGLPPTSLLGPLGDRRGVGLLAVELADLRARAHRAGVSINDVLLDAVAQAVDDALRGRGEQLRSLPISVPVSLRGPGAAPDGAQTGPGGNRVGVMRVVVPLDSAGSAEERLHRIARYTLQAKQEARASGTFELTRSRLGARIFDVAARHQRAIGLFITNIPGPSATLELGGARLRHVWPLTANAGNVRIAVAALSYAGTLHVTTTVDRASWPDTAVLTRPLGKALRGHAAAPSGTASEESPRGR